MGVKALIQLAFGAKGPPCQSLRRSEMLADWGESGKCGVTVDGSPADPMDGLPSRKSPRSLPCTMDP